MIEPVWYKQVWPWVLISIPFTAVLFGIFMITVVTLHPDDVVDDNYYKDGMAINQTLDMDRKALSLDVHARLLTFTPVRLAFAVDGAKDSALVLKFSHITDERKDRTITLYPEAGDIYATDKHIPIELGSPGVWYAELVGVDNKWRLRTRVVTPLTHMEFKPQ